MTGPEAWTRGNAGGSAGQQQRRRTGLSRFFLSVIAALAFGYTLVNTFHFHAYPLAAMELAVTLAALFDLHINRDVDRAAWATVLITGLLIVFYFIYVQARFSSLAWVVFFALIAFYLLGTRRGTVVYLAYVALMGLLVLLQRDEWPALQPVATLTNLVGALIGFGLIAYYQERSREEAHRRIAELANRDSLTGMANRRHFVEYFNRMRETLQAEGRPYALVLLDIDHFKHINDTHGHIAGDQVIAVVAKRLKANIRADDLVGRLGGDDLVGRLGGDEFAILLLDCNQSQAGQRAESLRQAIAATPIAAGGREIAVTISLGAVAADPETEDINMVLAEADRLLYAAKESGRNAVGAGTAS
ncbi:GGDEF domain-containing protein [Guyparkeria hydrothermalis]|uniref:GGDEF domain-containing protein n=1 Tax=Guyparkeria hydrothermalis TaxID=923 RepID=UPI0020211790|nr:GGDEF domain-containing protein [Guyparkeria hydrothermalis]MCL7743413.1 GGDEF domain-containing protein [Guyparkeria hydrothermalis]